MKNINWKKALPHIIAIAIFAIVAIFYTKPATIDGKVLQQDDTSQWKAMAQNSFVYKEKNGHFPLWTNGMFCGMPGYQIALDGENPFSLEPIGKITSLFLSQPASFFFIACLCFYFLACVLGCNVFVGIGSALCYAYCTYNPIILVAGHQTKILTIAYVPALIGSVLLVFNKKYIIGAALTAYSTMMVIGAAHLQITYYAIIIIAFMAVGLLINAILTKEFKNLFIAGAITIASAILGVGVNAVTLKTTSEYGKLSIRGGSALADPNDKNAKATKEGLSKDYAMSYSMYMTEPMVLMFANIFGGSSGDPGIADEDSKAVEKLSEMPQQLAQNIAGARGGYWGGIGGTSGPPYAGVIVCFLALIGFVVLDNKHKWWILACIIFAITLSWGKFYEGYNMWMLNHLPGYNKFRAPSMIMVIPTVLLGMMAALTLNKIVTEPNKEVLWEKYKKGLMVAGGMLVFAIILYTSYDYAGEGDKGMLKQIGEMPDGEQKNMILGHVKGFVSALREDRKSLFLGSIIRGIILMSLVGAILWLNIKNKLNLLVTAIVVGFISFVDLMNINAKYLTENNYTEAESYNDKNFVKTPTIAALLNDKSNYRVFNISQGTGEAFNHDAKTSYYLQSIGGYNPAKLSIYQDIIEKQLYNFPNCFPVVNMLNAKYIIQGDLAKDTIVNKDALGNCWFIKGVSFKETPLDVMNTLTTLNTKDSAVLFNNEKDLVKFDNNKDSASTIKLVKNENDIVEYFSKSSTNNFAVFSEVYYNAGWKAYIDGKEAPIVRTNYVLRGLSVPSGEHKIVFEFKPDSYYKSLSIAKICSLLIWILLIGGLGFAAYRSLRKNTQEI